MKRKFDFGTIGITLFTIIFTAVIYNKLPENIDSESTKVGLFVVSIGIMIVITIYAQFAHHISKKAWDDPRTKTIRRQLTFSTALISVLVLYKSLSAINEMAMSEDTFEILFSSILIIVVGNSFTKISNNRNIGIRVPWTRADNEIWDKTHKLSGYLSLPFGISIPLLYILFGMKVAVIIGVLGWGIVSIGYSIVLYYKKFGTIL
ncbi:SdpI family protein [Clostridium sp.]|uniref:SdpI family protein n=1 Tax=Clostridium sp. TaxID=1506 RepID=UPI002FC792B2